MPKKLQAGRPPGRKDTVPRKPRQEIAAPKALDLRAIATQKFSLQGFCELIGISRPLLSRLIRRGLVVRNDGVQHYILGSDAAAFWRDGGSRPAGPAGDSTADSTAGSASNSVP